MTRTYPVLINHTSNILLRVSDYRKSEEILLKGSKLLADDRPTAAATHNNLGMVYERLGDYSHALEEYEKARDVFFATAGAEHRDTATAFNNIAGVYTTLGKYKEAL
ncbi:MAG: tetratricopeptide repeat protein [Clostridiales bacterium]|nr:tetratricopeptide repeat protein [Clostridiales bacterium]